MTMVMYHNAAITVVYHPMATIQPLNMFKTNLKTTIRTGLRQAMGLRHPNCCVLWDHQVPADTMANLLVVPLMVKSGSGMIHKQLDAQFLQQMTLQWYKLGRFLALR